MANPLDAFDSRPSSFSDEPEGNPLDAFDGAPRTAPMPPRRPEDLTKGSVQPAQQQAPAGMSWSDVPGEAMRNLVPSAKSTALGMVEPFLNPRQTARTIYDIGAGLASKAKGAIGVKNAPEDEATVNAIGEFYKQRYGSEEGFKRALAEDPVGVMADMSAIVGGGGMALAKAPGMAGRIGEMAMTAGKAIQPVNVAATAASPAIGLGMKGLNYGLSLKSGAPLATLKEAYKAGKKGSEPFWSQLTGEGDPAEIVTKAHEAVDQLAKQRRDNYLSSMKDMAISQAPIDYTPINQALVDAFKEVRHGKKTYRPEAEAMLNRLGKEIVSWQRTPNEPNVNYHNIEGVDKLKQLVGEMRSGVQPGSPADKAATQIYNAIKNTLAKQDPNYLAAMGDYSEASDLLKQLKTTLSVNPKASVDTTLRKLLLTQKQVDGGKARLLDELKTIDPDIAEMIAGHVLHPLTPIGLRGNVGAALSVAHGAGAVHGALDPVSAIAGAAAGSPRVVGALNYGVGRMTAPGGGLPIMATAPLDVISRAPAGPGDREPEERPYFPGEDERPARKSGGRATISAKRLLQMVKASRRKIQSRTESILGASDEHVVGALRAANQQMQG
jgi:hypothetical protein